MALRLKIFPEIATIGTTHRGVLVAAREKVWEVLTNPRHLEKAIPGCEKLEEIEPGKYDATLKIGIAAVKGTYKGMAQVADPQPPEKYRLVVEGGGSPGFVKGEALIELSYQNQSTIVSYQGEGQVGGLIAGVGPRAAACASCYPSHRACARPDAGSDP